MPHQPQTKRFLPKTGEIQVTCQIAKFPGKTGKCQQSVVAIGKNAARVIQRDLGPNGFQGLGTVVLNIYFPLPRLPRVDWCACALEE
jgi:hypothetical protein